MIAATRHRPAVMPETIIHLIRHGHYPMLDQGVLAGRTPGHGLDAIGRSQADAIAASLASRPITLVMSGPLQRARETAAPLASRFGLEPAIDDALDELDFGTWTGRPWRSLTDDPTWHAWHRLRSVTEIPGGESMLALQARAASMLRRLRITHPEGEVALFTHADTIRALLVTLLGMPIDLMLRLEIAPGSRSTVRLANDSVCVLGVNHPA